MSQTTGKKKNSYSVSLRAPRLVTATTRGWSWKHFQVREVRDFQNFPVYSGLGKVRMQNINTVWSEAPGEACLVCSAFIPSTVTMQNTLFSDQEPQRGDHKDS